jgi:hypothetical protein
MRDVPDLRGQYLEQVDDGSALGGEAVGRLAGVGEHLEFPGRETLDGPAEYLVQLVRVEHAWDGWDGGEGQDGGEGHQGLLSSPLLSIIPQNGAAPF